MSKTKIIALVTLIVSAAVTIYCLDCYIDNEISKLDNTSKTASKTHDWECNFIIEDGYNGNGNTMYHYIDEYKRNTDHSITFVGDDGLLWSIPYPYFYIHINKKTEK